MAEVFDLSARRQPVNYTVRITHHWDDGLEVFVEDVADDDRSRASVADALERAARMFGTAPERNAMPWIADGLRDETRRLKEHADFTLSDLNGLKALIEHWQEDAESGLPCTKGSLEEGYRLVRSMIARLTPS